MPDDARRHRLHDLCSRRRSPTSPSAGRSSATSGASRGIRADDLQRWLEGQYRPARLILVGGRQSRARGAAAGRSAASAICRPGPTAARSRPQFIGGCAPTASEAEQAHLALAYPGLPRRGAATARRVAVRRNRWRRRLRRDCSRSCARSAASLIRSMPGTSLMTIRGMFTVYWRRPRRATEAVAHGPSSGRSRETAEALEPRRARRAPGPRLEAAMLMALETPLGPGRLSGPLDRGFRPDRRPAEVLDRAARRRCLRRRFAPPARACSPDRARSASIGGKARPRRMSAALTTLVAEPWDDWGLIDSGDGRKLERYGPVKVVRPEPQAMWAPALDDWDARRDLRARLGRGRRRALGPASPGSERGSWRAARSASTPA